ncbi:MULTISPECIES: hypothetical protein [Thermofilum]|nr:hypothetical protein [Thermofilum adornatum]
MGDVRFISSLSPCFFQEFMYIVKCSKCGYVFYRGEKIPNLFRIYSSVGGKCPRCGAEIDWVPKGVAVSRKDKCST